MASIKSSELITNEDGSIFHLHLLPEDLADDIILVGDPGRWKPSPPHFQQIELKKVTANLHHHRQLPGSLAFRDFHRYRSDNIDIVINELDALAHIDLKTKEIKAIGRTLNIVRIGTSGSVQADIPVDSFVISEKSIGCDGVLRFYANNESVCDHPFEEAFIRHCRWTPLQPALM